MPTSTCSAPPPRADALAGRRTSVLPSGVPRPRPSRLPRRAPVPTEDHRRGHPSRPDSGTLQYKQVSTKVLCLKFILAAVAVIGAGIWVSFIGDEIANTYEWSSSFVGSLLLAIITSMPEVVVAVAALRLGAIDMAVADILGANMLDIAHLFTVDLFYSQGPILSLVSKVHLITSVVIMVMSLLVIIGCRFRQKRKTFIVISWYSLVLIGLYIAGAYALFKGIGF